MKKLPLILGATLFCGALHAQEALTQDVLKELSRSFENNTADKALKNAISGNPIKKLVVNQENLNTPDTYFSISVNSKGITDQQNSGRCWMFTGLNVLRSKMISKYNLDEMQFSHVYLFFYDQLEKSNLFLQGVIDTRDRAMDDKTVEWLFRNPLSDGGQFTGVSDLIGKYGVVPKEAMAETYHSNNTNEIASLMKRKLREYGLQLRDMAAQGKSKEDLEKEKVQQMKTIYRMLVLAYGEPVQSFTWAPKKNGKYTETPKTYTPQSFYKEVCGGEDLNKNYVMLMNDPSRPFNKVYEIEFDRHAYDGHNWLYINLPIEDIKEMAIASLKDSTMLYFSCDVGKYLDGRGLLDLKNYDYGSLFNTTFGMDKKQRVQSFDSGSSHAMTLMAVDLDKDGKSTKWKVENSWGAEHGFAGHLIMTDEWFNEYMFRLVVNKKYCPKRILDLLKQQPTKLPAWDPMFSNEI